ncbi:hypothetical protein BC835DRAFT_1360059, partial [Cytidiella melzeri]
MFLPVFHVRSHMMFNILTIAIPCCMSAVKSPTATSSSCSTYLFQELQAGADIAGSCGLCGVPLNHRTHTKHERRCYSRFSATRI